MTPALDDRIFHALYASGHGTLTTVAVVLSALGSGWSIFAIVPLLGHPRAKRFAAFLLATLVVAAIVVFSMKYFVGRGRPFTVYEPLRQLLIDSPTDYSFPSGHAAGSFTFATFVAAALLGVPRAKRVPGAWLISVTSIVFAACVALSRVVLGFHFPSDILAGALIGTALGVVGGREYVRHAKRSEQLTAGNILH